MGKKVSTTLIWVVSLATIAYSVYAATTTNMGLDLPTVGVTTGPDWATMINNAFETVDAHDHSSGKGVQISNAGISSSAAISRSKIASSGASLVIVNDSSGALSGQSTLDPRLGGTGLSSYSVGDLLYASSATALSKLPIGSSSQVLTVSSGVPAWAAASPALAVTTQTGTYTISSSDDLILANPSASFTMTLPDATTNPGKVYRIKKIDSDFTKIVTISRAGSDTIQDASSTVTSTTLNTQGEEIEIVSTGSAAWQITVRRIPSVWTSFTPTGSWTSNSTYTGLWRRVGNEMEQQVNIAVTGGAPTNTSLTITMPTGIVINNSNIINTPGSGTHNPGMVYGVGYSYDASADESYVTQVGYGSTSSVSAWNVDADLTIAYVRATAQTAPFAWGTSGTDNFSVRFKIPVTGWNG